jgi:hypothetical protein
MKVNEVEPGSVILSPEECEKFSHALSDSLCWFGGFQAARGKKGYQSLPPGVDVLRSLNIQLKKGGRTSFG